MIREKKSAFDTIILTCSLLTGRSFKEVYDIFLENKMKFGGKINNSILRTTFLEKKIPINIIFYLIQGC